MPQRQSTNSLGPRTILCLFDGTSNEYDETNTNIVKLFSLLKKDDTQQLVYYQPGIGTYFNPGAVSPLLESVAKTADQAIAWYINNHVMDGYRFLQKNWRKGDKILLFGFSRGAYTARALAGMLSRVGLLPKDNVELVSFAFKLYSDTSARGVALAKGFKRTFSQDVDIAFLGVWDTVASVGILKARTLPFVNSNQCIKVFRHALALDEHRAKFRPNMYHKTSPNNDGARLDPEQSSPILGTPEAPFSDKGLPPAKQSLARKFVDRVKISQQRKSSSEANVPIVESMSAPAAIPALVHEPPTPHPVDTARRVVSEDVPAIRRSIEDYYQRSRPSSESQTQATMTPWHRLSPRSRARKSLDKTDDEVSVEEIQGDVLEVWFAGCHSDVGGGAVKDTEVDSLAQISLRWMTRELMAAQIGVVFDSEALVREEIPVISFPQMARVRSGTEEMKMNQVDALQPIHDEMKKMPLWWLLEIVPLSFSWQDDAGVWHKKTSFHLGRGREIKEAAPNFHVTVRDRMKAGGYVPRAQYNPDTVNYVE